MTTRRMCVLACFVGGCVFVLVGDQATRLLGMIVLGWNAYEAGRDRR